MGLEAGITSPIDAQWFPKMYAYHDELLPNDLQQLADSVDDAVRRHLSNAASESFAVMGVTYVGLDREATAPVIVLSGVRKEDLGLENAPFLVNRLAHLMNLAPRPITRPWHTTPSDSNVVAEAKALVYQGLRDQKSYVGRTRELEQPGGQAKYSGLEPPKLCPGRSISQLKIDTKGTFGIYVSRVDEVTLLKVYG